MEIFSERGEIWLEDALVEGVRSSCSWGREKHRRRRK